MSCDEHMICLNRSAYEQAAERDNWQAKASCKILVDEGLPMCQCALEHIRKQVLTSE